MRIALVVQPLERTPPLRYGAVELVVSNLAEGLIARRHQVTLFASGDSETNGRLIPATERALLHDPDYVGQNWWANVVQMKQVVEMQEEFDIINSHAGYAFLPAIEALRPPVVSTWHSRLHIPMARKILNLHKSDNFISICYNQQEASKNLNLNWVENIYNGIRQDHVVYAPESDGYLLFLGRITPVKQPDLAIRMALEAGLPIKLAGRVSPGDEEYFTQKVKPLLSLPGVEYLGELSATQKIPVIAKALALIHPSEWEACSLSILESQASGTPVLCLDRGGNRELVAQGISGFVCDRVEEMPQYLRKVTDLKREDCRAHYLSKFTADHMVENAIRVFENILDRQKDRRV